MMTQYISLCNPKNLPNTRNSGYQQHLIYGKPSKPRFLQPSMYEILSWNQTNREENRQNYQKNYSNNDYNQYDNQQQGSLKKIRPTCNKKLTHCKSLPAQQFKTNKITNDLLQDVNGQNIKKIKKKVKISDFQQYQQNKGTNNYTNSSKNIGLKQTIPISKSNKNIHSQNYISTTKDNQIKKQNQNKKVVNKNNQQQKQNLLKQKQKNQNKLVKKPIKFYSDPQKKPRYLQPKKSAVQILVQSQDFDMEQFERLKNESIKRFKQTTRDLSNTAFLTYFNKPPFQNYGRQNKHTAGVLYGDYMYSHNVYPHTGDNKPKNQQTYVSALGRAKSAGNIRPHIPLSRNLQQNLISGYLTLTQIYPKHSKIESLPIKNQTVLQNLPRFNLHKDESNTPKYSPYINGNNDDQNFFMNQQNKYLQRDEVPKFFSNKVQIQGKQITYTKKIQQSKKINLNPQS